jgi:phage nucleotide-binding protein
MSILPTKPNEVCKDFERQITWIYGREGIGKTTFASQYEKPLFIMTENGAKNLPVYEVKCTSWNAKGDETSFLNICKEIAKGNHQFKTIVIDTIDNLVKYCSDYVCEKQGIEHESDLGYSKGWKLVKKELFRVLNKLSFLPYGLVFIGHDRTKDIETRTGKYTMFLPNIPDTILKELVPMCDIVMYAASRHLKDGQEERLLYTKPSEYYVAKDRTQAWRTAEGLPPIPPKVPLDFKTYRDYFDGKVKPESE